MRIRIAKKILRNQSPDRLRVQYDPDLHYTERTYSRALSRMWRARTTLGQVEYHRRWWWPRKRLRAGICRTIGCCVPQVVP
jgi:hypothetical protein